MIERPVPLTAAHDTASFSCGVGSLDEWLVRRALTNQSSGASRTYVLLGDGAVIGYYALASGSVAAEVAPGGVRRNMPDPIPVMLLGRLAIDLRYQGQKLGLALLRDAVHRTLAAADIAGIRALLVQAIDDRAAAFYRRARFVPSPLREDLLFLVLDKARAALAEP